MNDSYRCRTCAHWRSDDGLVGRCAIPETPATVAARRLERLEAWAAAQTTKEPTP